MRSNVQIFGKMPIGAIELDERDQKKYFRKLRMYLILDFFLMIASVVAICFSLYFLTYVDDHKCEKLILPPLMVLLVCIIISFGVDATM